MRKLLLLCALVAGVGTLPAQNQQYPVMNGQMNGQMPQPEFGHMQHHAPTLPSAANPMAQMQNGTVQLLDSMYFYSEGALENKKEYTYDSHGNLTSEKTFSITESGTWELSSERKNTYDENNRLVNYVYYARIYADSDLLPQNKQEYAYNDRGLETVCISYSMQDGNWVLFDKRERSYDDNDREISITDYLWTDETWRVSYQEENTYDDLGHQTSRWYKNYYMGTVNNGFKHEESWDSNGNQTLYANYMWDAQLNQWAGDFRRTYTFDAYGNRTGYVYYQWQDGEWVIYSEYKYENTLDANDYLITEISYLKDSASGSWTVGDKTEYTRNGHGYVTSQISYYWYDSEWIMHFITEITYDDQDRILSDADYRISDGVRIGEYKSEYVYDSNGNRTLYTQSTWGNGEWVATYKTECAYDSNGNETLYTQYTWRNGGWAPTSRYEYTYDSEGRQTSYAYYDLCEVGREPYALSINLSGDPVADNLDDRGLLFTGAGYTLNGLYVDQYVIGHDNLGYVPVWTNNGSHGAMAWNDTYLFSGADFSSPWDLCAFPMSTWTKIKNSTIRVNLSECDDNAEIRITTGWWDNNYAGLNNCIDLVQEDANGKYLLLNFREDGHLYRDLDQQKLLFTGQGYAIKDICIFDILPEQTTADDSQQPKVLWENDGTHGEVFWDNTYSFGLEGMEYWNECVATFPAEEWELIKEGKIRVDVELLNDYWANIRITTGWWMGYYAGLENCFELVQVDANGNRYLVLDIKNDGNLYDNIDVQQLLFTGSDYILKRISVYDGAAETATMDELSKVTEDGYWKRHYFWKNDGSYNQPGWSNIYLFNSVENATGAEIATLSAEDWEVIKHDDFKADISFSSSSSAQIYVTDGWWSTIWTGNTLDSGSPYITGGPVYELRPSTKEEFAFDDYGNMTFDNYYIWRNNSWAASYTYVYYYSAHTTDDIRQIISELRPRISKQMRDGQVFIVVGDKTYDMNGREVMR